MISPCAKRSSYTQRRSKLGITLPQERGLLRVKKMGHLPLYWEFKIFGGSFFFPANLMLPPISWKSKHDSETLKLWWQRNIPNLLQRQDKGRRKNVPDQESFLTQFSRWIGRGEVLMNPYVCLDMWGTEFKTKINSTMSALQEFRAKDHS